MELAARFSGPRRGGLLLHRLRAMELAARLSGPRGGRLLLHRPRVVELAAGLSAPGARRVGGLHGPPDRITETGGREVVTHDDVTTGEADGGAGRRARLLLHNRS